MKERGWTALAFAVALMAASPAHSQCPIFLIPPSASLTDDEEGNSPWNLVERKDWVTAVPAQGSAWALGYIKLEDGIAGNNGPTCFTDKIRTNVKSGRVKVYIENEKTRKWIEKWLKIGLPLDYPHGWKARAAAGPWVKTGEDVLLATYEMPTESWKYQSASRNSGAIHHAAEMALDVVRNVDFKPPEIENQRTFSADFDKVWAAMIETLSDQKWQVESIDKGSGLVTTKPALGSRADMACATAYDKEHKEWLNVFVKRVDSGTRVKVNATFHAIREDEVISCSSNGTLEKEFFEAIQKNL